MIKQYKLLLSPQKGLNSRFDPCDAYALYGSLMQALSGEAAERLHSSDEPQIAHYLTPVCGGAKAQWTVSLLASENCPEAASILGERGEFTLTSKCASLGVEECKITSLGSLDELLGVAGEDRDCPRFHMRFVSPASFRVEGEYQFFPTVKHILRSLSSRWNAAFPAVAVSDEDAAAALENGTRMTGYELKSSYYRLKGNSIAAFTGSVTLSARLSPPLLQLLRGLLSFGVFGGVGIKTSLGMGGITLRESPRK